MPLISDEVKKFLEHGLGDSFGCDIDKVIAGCKNYGRFSAWLGGDESRIRDLLNKVSQWGMSPELFASKEIQEGFNGSWGWHNHTVPQGNYEQDAKYVVDYTIGVSQGSYTPAWDDPGAGTVGVVPADVIAEGNAHYASLKAGTIGRAYVAMTAAATWSMYYPQALNASVNGVQTYGNPLQGCIELIKKWGGTISGTSTQTGNQQPSETSTTTSNNGNKSNNTRTGDFSGGFYLQNSNVWELH